MRKNYRITKKNRSEDFRKLLWLVSMGAMIFAMVCMQIVSASGQSYCPVNLNADSLAKLRNEPYLYYGKMLACNGEIIQMEKGYKDKAYYRLKLEKGGTIWVSSQVESGTEKLGERMRILGFFEKAAAGYKPRGVNDDPYHLVGIAVLNLGTREMMMQPGQEKIVQQWLDGKIPEPGKRKWE